MEGIFDGQATDRCFYCALLHAETFGPDAQDACPRCGNRMRYRPAAMMSDADLRASVRQHLDAYARAASADLRRQRLLVLLEHLHRYAPTSLTMLAEITASTWGPTRGPTLDDLRRDYDTLF